MNTNRIGRAVLVALATFALAVGNAAAQKKSETVKKNDFPNATREEPKLDISEKGQKKIQSAYDALDEEDFAKAEKLLTEANSGKASKYEKALALQGLSQIAYEQDDVAKAIALNEQAIALNALDNTSHFNLQYQVAQMYLMDEKYAEALTAIEKYFKESGATNKAEAWALKGNALYRMDKFPEAAEAMKKAISLSPKPNDQWNQMLIATYYEGDNFAEASKAAEEVLAKNPSDKKTRQQLSSIYLEMEQNDKAIKLLEDAYAQGQLSDEKDLKQLYQLYNYVERPADAARVINDGLTKGILKKDADTYKGLGDAYALQSEKEADGSAGYKDAVRKATDAYGESVKLEPNPEVAMTRGHLLVELEDWANAKAALNTAISSGNLKRMGEAYILLGNAEAELGNDAAAKAAYQKALGYPSTKAMAESWLKSIGQN